MAILAWINRAVPQLVSAPVNHAFAVSCQSARCLCLWDLAGWGDGGHYVTYLACSVGQPQLVHVVAVINFQKQQQESKVHWASSLQVSSYQVAIVPFCKTNHWANPNSKCGEIDSSYGGRSYKMLWRLFFNLP